MVTSCSQQREHQQLHNRTVGVGQKYSADGICTVPRGGEKSSCDEQETVELILFLFQDQEEASDELEIIDDPPPLVSGTDQDVPAVEPAAGKVEVTKNSNMTLQYILQNFNENTTAPTTVPTTKAPIMSMPTIIRPSRNISGAGGGDNSAAMGALTGGINQMKISPTQVSLFSFIIFRNLFDFADFNCFWNQKHNIGQDQTRLAILLYLIILLMVISVYLVFLNKKKMLLPHHYIVY
jgi:hypothetical protein